MAIANVLFLSISYESIAYARYVSWIGFRMDNDDVDDDNVYGDGDDDDDGDNRFGGVKHNDMFRTHRMV